jgi:DNA polymerase II small subunit
MGMIKSKNVSQSGNIIIELEDLEDSIICIVPGNAAGPNGRTLSEKGNSLLIDEVICVSGYVDQDQRMIVRDIIFPDIPTARPLGRASRNAYAVFISDLHVGSQEFLEDEFHTFLNWLRGIDVDSELKQVVEQVRYLFIAGDLIDGIGVYPGQKTDLLLPDIYDQYKMLSKLLKLVPDEIKIICIPGNHDACRQALPKPPIPKQFAKPLYDLGDQIELLGDPSQVRVDGVSVLLTHGDSQDDLVTNIPGVSYREPAASMRELLKKRHLSPIYGGKTELAPLRNDWMVINQIPDIVHFGHAHHNAVNTYRGVLMINSGTFQSQTEFMKKQGIDPTPGIVTYVNLRSGEPNIIPFYDFTKSR